MNYEHKVVDLIERVNDAQPVCPCGRPTAPVWRDGEVWLECASLAEPRESRLSRAWAALTPRVHTRERIVEAPGLRAEPDYRRSGLDESLLLGRLR
jgi:hypothetical protein